MTGNTRYYLSLLSCGPYERMFCPERGLREKDKLSPRAQNYYKLFYRDGKLLKAESYIEKSFRGSYLCFYKENVRILLPFDENGQPEQTYRTVTWFEEGRIVKEAWFSAGGGQVVFNLYKYAQDAVEYEGANCLPHAYAAEDRIQSHQQGTLPLTANDIGAQKSC